MEALYFEGTFVVEDERTKRQYFEREVELARRALDLVIRKAGGEARFDKLARRSARRMLESWAETMYLDLGLGIAARQFLAMMSTCWRR